MQSAANESFGWKRFYPNKMVPPGVKQSASKLVLYKNVRKPLKICVFMGLREGMTAVQVLRL